MNGLWPIGKFLVVGLNYFDQLGRNAFMKWDWRSFGGPADIIVVGCGLLELYKKDCNPLAFSFLIVYRRRENSTARLPTHVTTTT